MKDLRHFLLKEYRDRLYTAAQAALYWPLRDDDMAFEPANAEYLSTPTRAFVRLAHPWAVTALLDEFARLEDLVEKFQEASMLWHGHGDHDKITPQHVRDHIVMLTRERNARTAQRDELVRDNEKWRESAKMLAQTNADACEKLQELTEENARLRAENERLTRELTAARVVFATIERKATDLEPRLTRLENLSTVLEAKVAEFKNRESYYEMLDEEMDQLLTQAEEDAVEIARLENAAENLVVDYGQLQLQLDEKEQENRQYEKRIKELCEEYIKQIEELQRQLATERALAPGEGHWVQVEALNKVAHALQEACDVAQSWFETETQYPTFQEDPGWRRVQQLREAAVACYFPPFETAWLCKQIASPGMWQYGEDALQNVRLGYEMAQNWLRHLEEKP